MSLGRISSGNSPPPLTIDIGLVVSNAGTENPGEFLKQDRQSLQAALRLSTMAHLDITHHFGAKLAKRRRGGLILAGAMGAENGVPCMANDGAAKAYVHSLGEALQFIRKGWALPATTSYPS